MHKLIDSTPAVDCHSVSKTKDSLIFPAIVLILETRVVVRRFFTRLISGQVKQTVVAQRGPCRSEGVQSRDSEGQLELEVCNGYCRPALQPNDIARNDFKHYSDDLGIVLHYPNSERLLSRSILHRILRQHNGRS